MINCIMKEVNILRFCSIRIQNFQLMKTIQSNQPFITIMILEKIGTLHIFIPTLIMKIPWIQRIVNLTWTISAREMMQLLMRITIWFKMNPKASTVPVAGISGLIITTSLRMRNCTSTMQVRIQMVQINHLLIVIQEENDGHHLRGLGLQKHLSYT